MPLLRVREGEEQGDLEGDEGEEEEEKVTTQVIKSSLAAELDHLLTCCIFCLRNTVKY